MIMKIINTAREITFFAGSKTQIFAVLTCFRAGRARKAQESAPRTVPAQGAPIFTLLFRPQK